MPELFHILQTYNYTNSLINATIRSGKNCVNQIHINQLI